MVALWFHGKGNIGYGANIGSNHTGRLPDQECIPGEGVFFGLGCNIKYPCNLQNSPYSIIASGVTMLPQRLDLPFSLINRPSKHREGISPELNEVFPGWILYGNYYMIVRNEDKFANRNKSKRNLFEMSIMRPDIISMVAKARNSLAFVPHSKRLIDLVMIMSMFPSWHSSIMRLNSSRFLVFVPVIPSSANMPASTHSLF